MIKESPEKGKYKKKGVFRIMKKNRMMRLASILLVATLMSTCTISGTFAKYVSAGSSTDQARVAKWGVEVTANGTMFKKEYAKDDTTYTLGDNTVVSSNTWNVVAPGTTANMAEVALTGTPEVATRVTYDATVTFTGDWTVNGDPYCPLIFKVEGTDYYINGSTIKTTDELAAAVKTAIAGCNKDYEPNTDLSTKSSDYPSVTWRWEFEGTEHDASATLSWQTDAKDTALGNKAVASDIAVKVDIATTVTQID